MPYRCVSCLPSALERSSTLAPFSSPGKPERQILTPFPSQGQYFVRCLVAIADAMLGANTLGAICAPHFSAEPAIAILLTRKQRVFPIRASVRCVNHRVVSVSFGGTAVIGIRALSEKDRRMPRDSRASGCGHGTEIKRRKHATIYNRPRALPVTKNGPGRQSTDPAALPFVRKDVQERPTGAGQPHLWQMPGFGAPGQRDIWAGRLCYQRRRMVVRRPRKLIGRKRSCNRKTLSTPWISAHLARV